MTTTESRARHHNRPTRIEARADENFKLQASSFREEPILKHQSPLLRSNELHRSNWSFNLEGLLKLEV
jgi:hypothetical protein